MSAVETGTWPEGTVARYLTVGGATVDITHGDRYTPTDDGIGQTRNLTLATCTGCLTPKEFSHWRLIKGMVADREERDPEAADRDAREWAQSHAEKCRALPKPDGAL